MGLFSVEELEMLGIVGRRKVERIREVEVLRGLREVWLLLGFRTSKLGKVMEA